MNKRQHVQHTSEHRGDKFYEVMPYTHGLPYSDHATEADQAVDKDLDQIEDEGRAVAVKTLVFVILTTLLICILLVWGVETARQTLPLAR